LSTQKKEYENLYKSISKMQSEGKKSFPNEYARKLKTSKELHLFFLGLIIFGTGLIFLMQTVILKPLGEIIFPNWLLVIPVLIGICMIFFMARRIFGIIVAFLGLVNVFLSIILSHQIQFKTASLLFFIVIFCMIVSGTILLLIAVLDKNIKKK